MIKFVCVCVFVCSYAFCESLSHLIIRFVKHRCSQLDYSFFTDYEPEEFKGTNHLFLKLMSNIGRINHGAENLL